MTLSPAARQKRIEMISAEQTSNSSEANLVEDQKSIVNFVLDEKATNLDESMDEVLKLVNHKAVNIRASD